MTKRIKLKNDYKVNNNNNVMHGLATYFIFQFSEYMYIPQHYKEF